MSARKKILVGVFIVGAVLLFAAGLFLIGSRKQIFGRHFVAYADFDNIDTLTTGAKVRVSGMDAGEVTQITVPSGPSSNFRLQLKVDEKFRPIVRLDSVASIETEGMVGNKYVNIAKGSQNSPDYSAGATLPSREPVEMGDLMREGATIAKSANATINDLRKRSDTAIRHVTALVTHVDDTVLASQKDVKAITANGANVAENANGIVSSIREGEGAAGKLLMDKSVASDVTATIANAKDASGEVKQASKQVDQASEKVNATTGQIDQAVTTMLKGSGNGESTAVAIRDTVEGADRAATNISDDTDALKHNFFLRGFFHRRGFYDLDELTPQKYASTEFVKKPRLRVWVPARGVFDNRQELSKEGQSIVNAEMAQLVRYLPNNPIMIEGYSSQGGSDEQYTSSRQRALAVEKYLETSFHIDPKFIGIIPLGDRPPARSGKESWDGVCLVLVLSR